LKCLGPEQCQECKKGFYLDINKADSTVVYRPTIGLEYSYQRCERCAQENCECTQEEKEACPVCIDNLHFRKTEGNEKYSCPACYDKTKGGVDNCVTCDSAADELTAHCLTCKSVEGSATVAREFYIVNTAGTACLKCPQYCYDCSLDDKGTGTTCNVDGCDNTYYRYKEGEVYKCKPCEGANVLRCKAKEDNSGSIPTQCKANGVTTLTTDVANTKAPHSNDYYLIIDEKT